ncbi:SRPBCC domain-containing protein [Streptomyces sp. NPDC096132]|uniref:SRPBCC domain-containing protein n=1 Tax=Streptomyces sp. NPDC096132 TaxID=3366075 RepID=UPI00382B85D9
MHLLVRLPVPMEAVWPAVSSPDGLAAWWVEADLFEPRLGGAVVLRGPGEGRVTAWDVDRVAEYTFPTIGRVRFLLERDGDTASVLRFTHEPGGGEPPGSGAEPAWQARFEYLSELLVMSEGSRDV